MTKLRSIFTALLVATGLSTGAVTAYADDSGDTEYPVVLVHGLAGFDSALGYDYFYGVEAALQASERMIFLHRALRPLTPIRLEAKNYWLMSKI